MEDNDGLFSVEPDARHRKWWLERYKARLLEVKTGLKSIDEMAQVLEAERMQIEGLADTDPLTGLLNRRGFLEEATEIRRLEMMHGHPGMAIVLLDVDMFKNFNDKYGHDVGDLVLQGVAKVLKEGLGVSKSANIVGRWGGEEFVACLPDVEVEGLEDQIGKIGKLITEQVSLQKGTEQENIGAITTSMGVAMMNQNEGIIETIKQADLLMYRAKNDGRKRAFVQVDRDKEPKVVVF